MLQCVSKEDHFYIFDKANVPVCEVEQREHFRVETYDTRGGQLKNKDQIITSAPNWNDPVPKTCPCTGPISVKGVHAGEAIKIQVHSIEVAKQGFVVLKNSMGVCKNMIVEAIAVFGKVEDNIIKLDCGPIIPVHTHIGTIGTTPGDRPIPTAFPGSHGGNLDCSFVDIGAEIYLPAYVDGALIGLGDVHAAMGEGELMGCGVEIDATVELSASSVSNIELVRPVVRSHSKVMTLASNRDIRYAIQTAAEDLVKLMQSHAKISRVAALSLLTTIADVKICQSCDEGLDAVIAVAIDSSFLPLPD